MSNTVHAYVSQSDKGELVIGGGSDPYVSYSQRGSFDQIEHVAGPIVELYPAFSRVKMLRQWAGLVDVTTDRSPLMSETPVRNLFFNCGWGNGRLQGDPRQRLGVCGHAGSGKRERVVRPLFHQPFPHGRPGGRSRGRGGGALESSSLHFRGGTH